MDILLLGLGTFAIAFLYSSVGHGGASGYIAWMILLGFAPDQLRPIALQLNIIVSLIACMQFYRSGHLKVTVLLPFVVGSIPMAYLGGTMAADGPVYKSLLGICLLAAGARLVFMSKSIGTEELRPVPIVAAIAAGGCIGWISGMIGIGGGVLLSPLLILARWTTIHQASAIAAPFIFLNSSVALFAGGIMTALPLASTLSLVAASVTGGWVGSSMGSRRFDTRILRILLAAVLLIAVIKLLF